MTAVALAPTRAPFLLGLNPLAKIAAALPAIVALVFARDLATPTAFLGLAYVVLLTGARWSARLLVLLGVVVWLLAFAALDRQLFAEARSFLPAPLRGRSALAGKV